MVGGRRDTIRSVCNLEQTTPIQSVDSSEMLKTTLSVGNLKQVKRSLTSQLVCKMDKQSRKTNNWNIQLDERCMAGTTTSMTKLEQPMNTQSRTKMLMNTPMTRVGPTKTHTEMTKAVLLWTTDDSTKTHIEMKTPSMLMTIAAPTKTDLEMKVLVLLSMTLVPRMNAMGHHMKAPLGS